MAVIEYRLLQHDLRQREAVDPVEEGNAGLAAQELRVDDDEPRLVRADALQRRREVARRIAENAARRRQAVPERTHSLRIGDDDSQQHVQRFYTAL